MEDKVNRREKFTLLDKPYSPGSVGYLNDCKRFRHQFPRKPLTACETGAMAARLVTIPISHFCGEGALGA
jgi:hypothetical protein